MLALSDTTSDSCFLRNIILSYMVWLTATRSAKLLPHLWKRPQDIIYVPAFILFGYYFAIMKLYALCTLHEVCYRSIIPSKFTHVIRLVGELVPALVMFLLRLQPLTTMKRLLAVVLSISNALNLLVTRKSLSHPSEIRRHHLHTRMIRHKHQSIWRESVEFGEVRKGRKCRLVLPSKEGRVLRRARGLLMALEMI